MHPARLIARPVRTAAVRRICEHPAMGRNIEHGPVMHTDIVGFSAKAALPARRDTRAAAEGDEQQGLYAAFALEVARTIFRDVFKAEVFPHEGILYVERHEIIEDARLFNRVRNPAGERLDKLLNIRREHDMRIFFVGEKRGLFRIWHDLHGIDIRRGMQVGIFHPELVVLLHHFFPVNSALRRILDRNVLGCAIVTHKLDLALLDTGRRDRDVYTHKLPFFKGFVLNADACADADAVCKLAVFSHQPRGTIQKALPRLTVVLAIHPAAVHNACTCSKGGIRFYQGLVESQEIMRLAVNIDPVDFVVVHHGVELRFRELRDRGADFLKRLCFTERIVLFQAENHFALADKARTKRFRNVSGKALINQAHSALKIAPCLAAEDILRQPYVQKLKIVVDVHQQASLSDCCLKRLKNGTYGKHARCKVVPAQRMTRTKAVEHYAVGTGLTRGMDIHPIAQIHRHMPFKEQQVSLVDLCAVNLMHREPFPDAGIAVDLHAVEQVG